MKFLQLSKIITILIFIMFSYNVSTSMMSCDEVKKYFDELPLDIFGHYAEYENYINYSLYIDSIFNGSCVSVEAIVEKFAQFGSKRYDSFRANDGQNMFDAKSCAFYVENKIEIINILKEKDKDFIYNFFYFYFTPTTIKFSWPPDISEKDALTSFSKGYDKNMRKILFEVARDLKKGIHK